MAKEETDLFLVAIPSLDHFNFIAGGPIYTTCLFTK